MTTVIDEPDVATPPEVVTESAGNPALSGADLRADLPAIVAELLATGERTAKAEADLEALKTETRKWYVDFTKDSWSFADSASLCSVWETCAAEAGIPGRPKNKTVTVSGKLCAPMTESALRQKLSISADDAKRLYELLPDDLKVAKQDVTWAISVGRQNMPAEWDPLDKKSLKGMCWCPSGRAGYEKYAKDNYGTQYTVEDVKVIDGCSAAVHS